MWVLKQPARFKEEYEAVEQLAQEQPWLTGVDWTILTGSIQINAMLHVHEHDYHIELIYPTFFPNTPIIVQSKDKNLIWSTHQYNGGVLCLEWGSDNWHPAVTGAQMLWSAYKLFEIENPQSSDELTIAPSRHHLTVGQELRPKYGRFFIGRLLEEEICQQSVGNYGKLKFHTQYHDKSAVIFVTSLESSHQKTIDDPQLPDKFKQSEQEGVWLKIALADDELEKVDSIKKLLAIVNDSGCKLVNLESRLVVLLVSTSGSCHFFLIYRGEAPFISKFAQLPNISPSAQSRIPSDLQAKIYNKQIGIVGLGSVGSKVAVSLARTGATQFVLVDFDIFLPENNCRNELDWRNVGEHKVYAIRERIQLINPQATVNAFDLHLTGQESNAVIDSIVRILGKCDLLIDATASSSVFNLLNAVVTASQKPLIWMEVYAGGIGGMIARSRPNLDPPPLMMRDIYENDVVSLMSLPQSASEHDYVGIDPDSGEHMLGTDGDVAVIAAHATRMAIDTIQSQNESNSTIYPHSMYAIGLNKTPFFTQPFDVRPISMENVKVDWPTEIATQEEHLVDALQIIKKIVDDPTRNHSSAKNN